MLQRQILHHQRTPTIQEPDITAAVDPTQSFLQSATDSPNAFPDLNLSVDMDTSNYRSVTRKQCMVFVLLYR